MACFARSTGRVRAPFRVAGVLSIGSVAAGIVVLVWVMRDVLHTVFTFGDGAGAQSGILASVVWRTALRLHDPDSERSHARLRSAGPLIVLLALALWVGQLTLSWALIFVPSAFEGSSSATFGDRFVFAGKTVIGRAGNSPELSVTSGTWEAVHGVAGLSGVTLVSIGLAYVLPILGGVADKRSVAAHINALGPSVGEIKETVGRAGGGQIELHLIALVTQVSETAERHRTYPVLHYFHSNDRHAALAPAIAKLVLLLEDGLDAAPAADATVFEPLNRAIRNLLEAVAKMGLYDYATRIDSGELNDIGLHEGNGGNEVLPNRAWIDTYVRFDGWNTSDIAI